MLEDYRIKRYTFQKQIVSVVGALFETFLDFVNSFDKLEKGPEKIGRETPLSIVFERGTKNYRNHKRLIKSWNLHRIWKIFALCHRIDDLRLATYSIRLIYINSSVSRSQTCG